MDIRNFFGASAKKKSSSSSAPASSAASKSKSKSKSKPAASNSKSKSPASKKAVKTPSSSSRGSNAVGNNNKKAAAKSKREESGSDTEMEDNDNDAKTEDNDASILKSKAVKKRAANDSDISDNDGDDTDDEVQRALDEAKRKRKAAASSSSIGSGGSPAKKVSKVAARPARRQAKKVDAFESIDSDDDDDDDDDEPPPPRRARRPAKKKVIALDSDSDSEVEEVVEEKPRRRTALPRRTSPRKRVASPAKKSGRSRRKIVADSDSDNDNDDEDEVMMDSDNDNDSDEDFKNDDENENDDSDSEEEEEPPISKQSKKRKASPASASKRSSPRKKSPARAMAMSTPAKSPVKRAKSAIKREPASVKRKPQPAAKAKVEAQSGPPKYHPPSSELTTHVPYLLNNPKLPHPLSKAPPLPALPDNNPNFSLDALTPHCLEGLTFVFSGILSTNEQKTRRDNADLSKASPSKADYYKNRGFDCADGELSRDSASDIVKSLGGRVTTGISGKTNYLVVGSVLEDGREVEEGSKYRKCVEIWEGWRDKWRNEYEGGTKKKAMTKAQKKDQDPDSLVEIVRGIYEFYGLVVYLSEWKKGTLSVEERMELEAQQQQQPDEAAAVKAEPMTIKEKEEVAAIKSEFAAVASTPASSKLSPDNPYSASSASSGVALKTEVANPYAKKSPANPYAKKSPANPYATKPSMANPYAKKASPANPYASSSSAKVKPEPVKSNHPIPHKKELGENCLWADKYAPSYSGEILGNADSVNKLKRWLNGWESTFNNPKRVVKGLSGPQGPWKAALLSGPPGIGKTTTATLVAQESGRDVLELNASDARSKKALTQALGDVTGSQVLSFDNMNGGSKKAPVQRRCVIMDEVDGMGAGDRSGMSELIQMIKKSKVPIICICNDRQSQKMKSLVQYCMDLRYRRPTKMVIARRAVEIGRLEGMQVEINAAEAMAESCGNDIRQVLNSLQMWSCKKRTSGNGSTKMSYRDLKERQGEINKDEILRVSMFDACRSIVEGSRNLAGADARAVTASLLKRTDAFFVDYMLMGLMVHQNYLKVSMGQYNAAKIKGDEDDELAALESIHEATHAMSDYGMAEESLRGGDQNWSLLPLCSVLAVKVGHHAAGPTGGILPGYPEFAGWLGKNSSRGKKIRLLQELRRHMNYKVSADASELRMNYLPIMREQFQQLLFDKEGTRVTEAIELMDEYGLDRDDVFENLDEFTFNSKALNVRKFGDMDSKSKAAFTRAYNSMAHKAQALVAEQGAEKTGKRKAGGNGASMGGAELDVVDDDKAAAAESEDEDEEDLEALKKQFLKKGRGSKKAAPSKGKGKAAASSKGKRAKK